MTIDEYKIKIGDYDAQIIALRNKKNDLRKEFINEMTKKYENFIGKKVKISFTSWRCEESVIGYFNGFISGTFCPIIQLFKVKKDGTKTKQIFNASELPHYDDNFKIEIVENSMDISKKNLNLIVEWFEHIQQLADDRKTLNGDVMSEADTLDEIKALSTRSANFIKKRYLSEKTEVKPRTKNMKDRYTGMYNVGDILRSLKNPRLTYNILETGHINERDKEEYKVEIFADGKAEEPRNIKYIVCEEMDKWAAKLILN